MLHPQFLSSGLTPVTRSHVGVADDEVSEDGYGHQVVDAGHAEEGEEEARHLTHLMPQVPAMSGHSCL